MVVFRMLVTDFEYALLNHTVRNNLQTTSEIEVADRPADLAQGRFLTACRRQPVDATPIGLMRQAGRYMAEQRALRQRHTILEIIKTPELAGQVTLQPIGAFDLDAAIIFADILPPLAGARGRARSGVAGRGLRHRQPLSRGRLARLRQAGAGDRAAGAGGRGEKDVGTLYLTR